MIKVRFLRIFGQICGFNQRCYMSKEYASTYNINLVKILHMRHSNQSSVNFSSAILNLAARSRAYCSRNLPQGNGWICFLFLEMQEATKTLPSNF